MPRAGQATRRPHRAAAAIPRATSAYYDQGVFTFFKVELLWSFSPLKKVKRAAQRKPPENTKATPQQQGTAFLHALRREPFHPWNALRRRLTNVRKNSSPVRQFSASTAARQAPLFRPLPLMQRVAGAKAIPDARRADRAPQQARTSPRPQAGEGSRRCPMRHAADGVEPNSGDKFRVPA